MCCLSCFVHHDFLPRWTVRGHCEPKHTLSPLGWKTILCKTMALVRGQWDLGQTSGSEFIFILIGFKAVGPKQTQSVRKAGLGDIETSGTHIQSPVQETQGASMPASAIKICRCPMGCLYCRVKFKVQTETKAARPTHRAVTHSCVHPTAVWWSSVHLILDAMKPAGSALYRSLPAS